MRQSTFAANRKRTLNSIGLNKIEVRKPFLGIVFAHGFEQQQKTQAGAV